MIDDEARRLNQANWDTWAAAHGQDEYYDLAGLIAGRDSLLDIEDAALALAGVPDVRGLDVLHVQCHLGFDAVSLARRGARVTGVDFAPVAVRRAAEIAARCGAAVEYVRADSTDLPASLHGRFAVAYATLGVLCWIGDIDAWMRSVAACLRPHGVLVLVDGHPLGCAAADEQPDDGLRLDFPYAFDGPHRFESTASYALDTEPTVNVQYAHSLGEIVTAALGAGLRVTGLVEHLDTPIPFGPAVPELDGRYRLRANGIAVPLAYTLTARRDA